MAVHANPYREWENLRSNSDYRTTDTQVSSLVRQQLSQAEYLRDSNRVNPGPARIARTQLADSATQIPHVLGSEDMWGWQRWASANSNNTTVPNLATSLLEIDSAIPGMSYFPYNEVGGASHIGNEMATTWDSDVSL